MKLFSRLLFFGLLLGVLTSCDQSPLSGSTDRMTATGFYWPTGTSELGPYAGWLSDGCSWSGNTTYFANEYHIGKDIKAGVTDPVYAIADGEVLHRSANDWGEGNVALLIVHTLSDGSSFTAIYGHIRSDLEPGAPVEAGKSFASVGPWYNEPHLHFGIRPGTSLNAPYGRMLCPAQGPISDLNGFVDPVEWITTKSPGTAVPSASQQAGTEAHSSPENVVRAWIQAAVVEGDCQKAATYYAPFRKDDVWHHCGAEATFRLVRVEIYDIIVEPDPFRAGITLVTVKGTIERKQLGEPWHKTNTFETEEIDGKWYFVDE